MHGKAANALSSHSKWESRWVSWPCITDFLRQKLRKIKSRDSQIHDATHPSPATPARMERPGMANRADAHSLRRLRLFFKLPGNRFAVLNRFKSIQINLNRNGAHLVLLC
jgi:hypothetical protein